MIFGEYLRTKRLEKNLSLRKFCKAVDVDPSDWSRIERGFAPPFKDQAIIERIADYFELSGDEREQFLLSAEIARKRIPKHISEDDEIMSMLPAFFHGTTEELRAYIESITTHVRQRRMLEGHPNTQESEA